jgi:hypothetical protein
MSLPFLAGSVTWAALFLINFVLSSNSEDSSLKMVRSTIRSGAAGVGVGVFLMLFSEPVTITGAFQDKLVEQNLLSSSTIALIETNDGLQKIKLPSVTGLGLKEGDAVKVTGVQYFTPSLRDFFEIDTVN